MNDKEQAQAQAPQQTQAQTQAPEPVKAPEQAPETPANPPRQHSGVAHQTSNGITIAVIVCIIISIISLGLSIFSVVQTSQNSQKVNGLTEEYGDDSMEEEEEIGCTLPTNIDEIQTLYINYNDLNSQISVANTGEINYYSFSVNEDGDETSSSKYVETDTTDIMQYVYNNNLNHFGKNTDNEDVEEEESWAVEMEMASNNICVANGSGATPEWVNSLVELINAKRSS